MSDVILATTERDTAAFRAIEEHHAELAGALAGHARAVLVAARGADPDGWDVARRGLLAWCERELLPHATAEEESLYLAASDQVAGRLLVRALLDEHRVLAGLVAELARATDAVEAAAAASGLRSLFDHHAAMENELVLPLLATAPGVSLADLSEQMHEAIVTTGPSLDAPEQAGGHTCGCGGTDDELPVLDARDIPHAIRHATIFGALDAVAPGAAMVLVAPHDPLPLLSQVEQRDPGRFAVDYLERGPEAWRLRFLRRTA